MDNAARQRAIREATLKSVNDRNRLSDQAVVDLMAIYQDAGEAVAEQIRLAAGGGERPGLNALQDLLGKVQTVLEQLASSRQQSLYRSIDAGSSAGSKPFAAALAPSQLFAINQGAVQFVRSFAAADGLQLSDRLWRLQQGDKASILGHIQQAIINGEDASHAMMRAMGRGEGVPEHIAQAYQASKVGALQKGVRETMTGAPDPVTGRGVVYQAERLFRTEINRAHGESYMGAAFAHPDTAGVRFCLSPNHRVRDVCDTHASADLYNLGPGIYPTRAACPWPAHPNTRSFVEVVFRDEVAKSATPSKPEAKKSPAVVAPAPAASVPLSFTPLRGLAEIIGAGDAIVERLVQSGPMDTFLERMHSQLNQVRPTFAPCRVVGSGKGADLVKAASMMFPDDWTKVADAHGPLNVRASSARGFCYEARQTQRMIRLPVFGTLRASKVGEGFIAADNFGTAVHEYAHRLQHSVPGLDDLFQDLHRRRTFGDAIEPLRRLLPKHGYGKDELTQKDHYIHPYQGRIYPAGDSYNGKHGALEVMSMAFDSVLSGRKAILATLAEKDREMLNLVVGALFHYAP